MKVYIVHNGSGFREGPYEFMENCVNIMGHWLDRDRVCSQGFHLEFEE